MRHLEEIVEALDMEEREALSMRDYARATAIAGRRIALSRELGRRRARPFAERARRRKRGGAAWGG